MRDAIKRIPGVADVRIFGERKYAMRLWLDPVRLAARGLTASDVVAALREQNAIIAAGQVGQPPAPTGQTFQISVSAAGRLTEPREFEQLVLKRSADGGLVLLRDVGTRRAGRRGLLAQPPLRRPRRRRHRACSSSPTPTRWSWRPPSARR